MSFGIGHRTPPHVVIMTNKSTTRKSRDISAVEWTNVELFAWRRRRRSWRSSRRWRGGWRKGLATGYVTRNATTVSGASAMAQEGSTGGFLDSRESLS